ncbi:Ig-like domain-containing protein [Duganella sp. PWIR1]
MTRLLSRLGGWIWRDWRGLGTAAQAWLARRFGARQPGRQADATPAPFTFEALEPRVLLSGDLSIGAFSYAPAGVAPGNVASATIELLRQGSDAPGDAVRVKVYASPDGTLDAQDRLLGQLDVAASRLAGQGAVQVQVALDTGAADAPGAYRLIAVADTENHYAESDENNNSALAPGALALSGTVGETPDGIIPALTLTDADGTRFTLAISGKGSVTVAGGAGGYTLQASGTDAASAITLTASGGDGRVLLAGVTVTGSLKSLSLAAADLSGSLTVSGALRTLVLRDASGAQINTGGSGLLDVTGRNFSGVRLQTTQVADVVKLNNWTGGSAAPSSLQAGGLNNLTAAQQFTADLVLSGVGAGALVLGNFKAGGTVGASLWSIGGRAGNIAFGASADGWHANIKGALSQLAVSGNLSGLLAAGSIQLLQVGGSAIGFTLLAGADLGSDAALGGAGAAADKFAAATVARIRISGAVSGSTFLVGVDPVNGLYGDGDDSLLGAAVNRVQELYIGGALDSASRIVAPAFPATVSVNGATVAPAALAQLSSTPRDAVAPVLSAGLAVDTGASTSDGLTANPAVAGTAIDLKGATALFALLDPADAALPATDLSASLQPGGAFSISAEQLAALAGGTLAQGAHTLRLQARDAAGNASQTVDVSFVYDSLAPAVTAFDLDAASDTGVAGDHLTNAAEVTLAGSAASAVSVKLLETNAVLAVGADGSFAFSGVALAIGVNSFTVAATDAAGNVSQYVLQVTRTGDAGPALSAVLQQDTGSAANDGITSNPAIAGVAGGVVKAVQLLAVLDPAGDAPPQASVSAGLQADGSYTISAGQLDALAGGALADGLHVLRLQAVDAAGNKSAVVNVSFTLDRAAPPPFSFALAAADASNAALTTTTSARVQLKGVAEAGALLRLESQNLSALAAADGAFVLAGVNLALGDNVLTLTATDAAGNARSVSVTLTRVAQQQKDAVLTWNNVALRAIQLDVTDPPVATRTLAMQSLSMYDVLAAIEGTPAYLVQRSVTGPVSAEAAVAVAAHRILSLTYPGQKASFDAALAASLAGIAEGTAKNTGIALGLTIADGVWAVRSGDGEAVFTTYDGGNAIGQWRPTGPIFDVADNPNWGGVTPFALASADQFRAPPPPALDTAAYAHDVEEIRALGSATGSTRTADQTQQALFWADGTGSYTPPGHWNQIAAEISYGQGNSLSTNARLFAQLNVALADAAIAAWDTKYAYGAWRPETAIHFAAEDGNDGTTADAAWRPLLITPPHPDYVSGHSTFSAAAATILSATFGANTAFSTTSATLPGVTRNFTSFQQAAEEAGRSRIYGGIHFSYANAAGAMIGQSVAEAVLARFALSADTLAPSVVFAATPAATNTNLTLTGQVLDNLSGVASARYRIDDGAVQALTLDADGRFSITTALATDGTADGAHTITVLATDAAGNINNGVTRTFQLDTSGPAITLRSVADLDTLTADARLTGAANGATAGLASLSYHFDNGPVQSVIFDQASGAFDTALPYGDLGVGTHTLTLSASDTAGNTSALTRTVTVDALAAFGIAGLTPADGAGTVGVTVRPQVTFTRAVNTATLTADSFYATGPDGARLAATIVPALDGSFAWLFITNPMPGGAKVTLHVDGSKIRAAADGAFLDADGNGSAGGLLAQSFTTVSSTPVAGTKLVGRVVDPGPDLLPMTFDDIRRGPDGIIHTPDDVFLNPIAHAKVFILGREDQFVYTDANGYFTLNNLSGGDVKVAIDGRTATNAPAGVFFPEMVMDAVMRAGQTNTLMGTMGTQEEQLANLDRVEVYLPRIASSVLQTVSDTVATVIDVPSASAAPALTDAERARMTLTVQPGSLIGENGQPVQNAQIGISTVPPELVRDMLPPGVLQHTFDITIQAPGVAAFSTPVEITFPNVFNAAPGTKLNILSFDHTTGRLVINGTGTVSADGLTVVSDPGAGVRAPGWHGMTPPGVVIDPTAPPPMCLPGIDESGNIVPGTVKNPGQNNQESDAAANLALMRNFLTVYEGNEFVPYVPSDSSGWTIGVGVELRAVDYDTLPLTEAQRNELKTWHDAAESWRSTLGGQPTAKQIADYLALHPMPSSITETDINNISNSVIQKNMDEVAAKFDATKGSSVPNFASLSLEQQKALTSLYYNFGNKVFDYNVWKNAAAGKWEDVVKELQDPSKWKEDGLPGLRTRRNAEADLIKSATTPVAPPPAAQPIPTPQPQFPFGPLGLCPPDGGGILIANNGFGSMEYSSSAAIGLATATSNSASSSLTNLRTSVAYASQWQNLAFVAVQDLATGDIIQRWSSDNGKIASEQIVLPPNKAVRIFAVTSNNMLGHIDLPASNSGTSLGLGALLLHPNISIDTDNDGLNSDIEWVIGTSDSKADSNGDGITDLAAIGLGPNPLGPLTSSGIIGAVALQGSATSVEVSTSPATNRTTAFVASAGYGLAIADVTDLASPKLLTEIRLTGEIKSISVDAARSVAAVAAGNSGIHLLDLTDLSNVTVTETLRFQDAADAVQVRDGLAYVATGSSIAVIGMLSGEILQLLDLSSVGGSAIHSIAIDGSNLFTIDAGNTLRSFAINGSEISLTGKLSLPLQASRVFVGGGIAYIGNSNGFTEGFSTVDVSDPSTMQLISGPDATNIGGRVVVPNGSGLAVSIGSPGGVFGGNVIDVLDVSDPANTNSFITRYQLPATPMDAVIANGLAYVADGTAGLQIVNYLAFDNKGQAPEISITVNGSDADPSTPGIQVLEGRTVHIKPTISDDVQVRNVELLVNGEVVSNDVSFPFDLFTQAPAISAAGNTLTLQVRATDTGGNVAVSDVTTLTVVPDTFPPLLNAASVADGERRFFVRSIDLSFDEPLDTGRLDPAGVSLLRAGADGQFGTADDTVIAVRLDSRAYGQSLSVIADTYLSPGEYRLRIDPSIIADRAGNQLADAMVRTFTVRPASDIRAVTGVPEIPTAPSANPGQQIGIAVPFDPATAKLQVNVGDSNGGSNPQVVGVSRWDSATGTAWFNLPANATSGDAVVYGLVGSVRTDFTDGTFPLQIVPVVTGVDVQSVSADGSSAVLLIYGTGFVEGQNSEYRFGSGAAAVVITDAGNSTGPDVQQVYDPYYAQYINGQVYLTVPLSNGAFGPISVKTAGGISASFTASLDGVTAVALSGTPADPALASANPGQVVKLRGAGLSTDSDILLRYVGHDGAPAMLRLSPISASADGTEATLVLPDYANGAFALQMFGSASQPLLQIVPTLTSIDGTSALFGSGFVEGATTYQFAGSSVADTAVAAGIDVSYYYDPALGAYIYNGQANFGSALPAHFGFGTASVTTAGGTSAALPVTALRPGSATEAAGTLSDLAVDPASGALWALDQDNPGHLLRIDPANGLILQTIALTPAMGNQYTANYGGLQIAAQALSLGGTAVPAGALIVVAGYPYNGSNSVAAIDPATGALIAKLVLPVNYYATAGLIDPASGHLFLLSHQFNQMIELDAASGAELARVAIPFNVQSYAGMAIDPVDGNFWIGSYNNIGELVKVNHAGVELRRADISGQGLNSNQISGLAFAPDGSLRIATVSGLIHRATLGDDFSVKAPTLTAVAAAALQGTPAQAAVANANVGQMIELTGSNFGAGTQVLFNVRDNAGKVSVLAVRPQLINAAGTRLQVLVPELATTGEVRVSNVGTTDSGFGSQADGVHRALSFTFTASGPASTVRFADGGLEALDNESWGLDNVVVRNGANVLFADDFEAGAKAAWSNPLVHSSSAQSLSAFSGRFNNASQTLSLSGLTAGQTYTVSFDLYALDSWDGSAGNPDQLSVAVDGNTVFTRTISNSVLQAQTVNATPGIRLQIVPTLESISGRPGQDDLFTLTGSGYAEGATTVMVGGIAVADPAANTYPFDITGPRNGSLSLSAPRTLDGPIRVSTEGGYAELPGSALPRQTPVAFTGITAGAAEGQPADAAQASANSGQTIVLKGQGFSSATLVQFQAIDDSGKLGTVTVNGDASSDGTALTVRVPVLARSGPVTILGSNASYALQIVPVLRAVGGSVTPGQILLIEGTGLVSSELAIQVDGRGVGNFKVETLNAGDNVNHVDQQLLRITVPAGAGGGVITISTAGGSATIRSGGVSITALPDSTPADAGETLGTAITPVVGLSQSLALKGNLASGTDIDLYRVTLAAGEQLSAHLSGHPNSQLRLFDANGVQVLAAYRTSGDDKPLTLQAPAAGNYFVGVSAYYNNAYNPNVAGSGSNGGYTGDYTLNLVRLPAGASHLSGIAAVAASGTPAQAALASANTEQTITLNGSGLLASDQVVFSVLDDSGWLSSTTVAPTSVAADGSSLTVAVPVNATTGGVRLQRDRTGVLLQIVPTLTGVDANNGGQYNGGPLRLTGSGYAEGSTAVLFGALRLDDISRYYGIDVNNAGRALNLSVPEGAPSGPIRVSTVGGTSAALTLRLTGISATAASGVAAVPGLASAVPGQMVTLTGIGITASTSFSFRTIDASGNAGEIIVRPTLLSADGSSAEVRVPVGAVTGNVRMVGDITGTALPLQILPVVTGVDVQSVSADGSSAVLLIYGTGFVEGQNSEYRFGSGGTAQVIVDAGAALGPDVQQMYDPLLGQYINGQVYLTVPLSNGAFGPISVKTAGGISASFTASLDGVTAAALSGTPANPALASANPGQVVKLRGAGLSTDSDILLRYVGHDGAPAMLRLSPISASADGTEATLVLPDYANGAFALQMFGSASQPLLQIVPTLTSINGTSALFGSGFVEGATTYQFAGSSVADTAVAAGIDVSYYYDPALGTYIYNGQANFGSALPAHFGFGTASVTTAGGTSAALPVTALRPGSATEAAGTLSDLAVDPASGALWALDQDNPGHLLRIDPANGLILQTIALTPAMGNQYTANYGGLQIAAQALSLGGTAVPAGALIVVAGYPYNGSNSVAAIDPATGALIAKLVLPVNYYATAGLIDPASGHLFLLSHQFNQMIELDAASGAELARVAIPFNVQSYAGMAIDPVDGNFWIGSYNNIGELVKVNHAGVELRRADISGQGLNSNQISGLAFAPDGSLRIATVSGLIHRATLGDDFSVKAPTLTAVAAAALQGTPAQAAVANANVGQMIELTGSNFGAGTQVLFNVRDNAGKVSVLAVRPQLINAAGTRLQVLVPELATTGEVRVSNVGTTDSGFGSQADGVHRALSFTFTASGPASTVRFADGGLEALDNESWGLDNVVVRNGANVLFADDFEAGAKAAWSNPLVHSSSAQSLSAFSGRFNNASQTLSLSGLTAGQTYTVSFDLYALDSWDGSAGNPDQLSVAVDGNTVFTRTISNSVLQAQTVNATPGIRLQIVPTLESISGRPGQDDLFTLTGSGYAEGATTVTVGGIAVADPAANTYPFDITGPRNGSLSLSAPRTLDGPIRISTEGGYAELAGPSFGQTLTSRFTGIGATSVAGQAADATLPSANSGQTIVLSGQGFTSATLVQFQAADDSGRTGTVTRGGVASADGRQLTVRVPALARTGEVTVLGSGASFTLQVVPVLRAVSGVIAAGNTLLIDASGLAADSLSVDIDGKAATVLALTTLSEGASATSQDQQLLRVLVPTGTTAGALTVHTAGGSSTLHTSAAAIASQPDRTPADAGATLAAAVDAAPGINQRLTLKAAIANGGDVDLYRVDLNAGERLTYFLSEHYYSMVRLFNAAGVELDGEVRGAGNTTPFDFTASSTGSYYIGISGYYNNNYDPLQSGTGNDGVYSGNYSLNLVRQLAGSSHIGAIAASADSGTAAVAALPSANVQQTITLTGSGLQASDQVVFTVINDNGQLSLSTVAAASVAADGNSLTVVVPLNATTGAVRLARDDAGVVLQVVPTLSGLETNPGGAFDGATLRLRGSGYAEGTVSVLFGARRIDDMGSSYGIDVYDNGRQLSVVTPAGAATGPIRISTAGGTSAALGATFTGIVATASSGTPADAALPSAVPGQTIQINGTGLTSGTEIVFTTLDHAGNQSELLVSVASVNGAQTQALVKVPAGAVTGKVRVAGDLNGASNTLQVLPAVTGISVQSVAADGSTATVLLYGSGLVEGMDSSYSFGSVLITDAGNTTGPDVQQVYDSALGQYVNGAVYLTVPLSDGVFGAITVHTAGGASAAFSTGLAGITASAASGTPADPSKASANARQSITLTGTGLSTDSTLLLRYINYNGQLSMLRLNPVSALANGTSATLEVPLEANGAYTLQMLGSSAQPLLQIVPTLDRFTADGQLYGSGFVEGATQYTFPAAPTVADSAVATGVDVTYYYDAARGGYQWNGLANISNALLPHFGSGNVTVTTAGGTAAMPITMIRPGSTTEATGALADVAVNRSTGALWTLDQNNPGHLLRIDPASGLVLQSIALTPAMGNQYTANYAGLQVLPSAATLAGVAVPAGSLLLFEGYPYNGNNAVAAIDPATGALIAKLELPVSYYSTAGVYDAASGQLFLLSHQLNQMVALNPATGAEIARYNLPLNVQNYAGMALDPSDGNFWIAGYSDVGMLVKISKTGTELRRVDAAAQGINANEISGLAFDADGSLRVASVRGVIYRVSVA